MSKKSTSQKQETQQTDSRLVVDNGAIGNSGAGGAAGEIAVAGSNNSLVMTDHGLVDSAFKYLMARDIASGAQVDKMISASSELSKTSLEKASASDTMKTALYAALGGLAVIAIAGAAK